MAARGPDNRWGWGLGGLIVGVALAAAGGWWFMAGPPLTPGRPESSAERDIRPAPATVGGDAYLSAPVTLVVREDTDIVDFPSQSGGAMLRRLTRGASVTGRWVRGADVNSRWLRLADGGYVYSASLARPVRAGVLIALSISNRGCQWGGDIQPYFDRAIAQRQRAQADDPVAHEEASFFVPVPARRWHNLAVTGVAVHYEAVSIYFRQPVDEVRRTLREQGIEVSDLGEMPIRSEDAVEAQSLDATQGDATRYGASAITCGV
jgi:hypothetical protein